MLILLKKNNTGMTTSDIFKRPGIYHEGKVHVRKKYENDEAPEEAPEEAPAEEEKEEEGAE